MHINIIFPRLAKCLEFRIKLIDFDDKYVLEYYGRMIGRIKLHPNVVFTIGKNVFKIYGFSTNEMRNNYIFGLFFKF